MLLEGLVKALEVLGRLLEGSGNSNKLQEGSVQQQTHNREVSVGAGSAPLTSRSLHPLGEGSRPVASGLVQVVSVNRRRLRVLGVSRIIPLVVGLPTPLVPPQTMPLVPQTQTPALVPPTLPPASGNSSSRHPPSGLRLHLLLSAPLRQRLRLARLRQLPLLVRVPPHLLSVPHRHPPLLVPPTQPLPPLVVLQGGASVLLRQQLWGALARLRRPWEELLAPVRELPHTSL
mmetsp:Transcript_9274/g.18807  ORF Transcript_9274/g.18807 Transcript_9274/m.18807 type:complete len:231 (+) Transcript_9274:217-909(+)